MKGGDYVKLKGLSKASLNGRIGVVHNKNHTSGRFNVGLIDGSVLALKPENIEKIDEPGQYDLANDLYLKKKNEFNEKGFKVFMQDSAKEVYNLLKSITPPGLEPNLFLGVFFAVFLSMVFTHGFFKAFLFVYTTFATIVVCFPVYKSSGGGINGVRSAVKALGTRTQQMVFQSVSYHLSENIATLLALGNIMLVMGLVFFTGGSSSPTTYEGSGDLSYEEYKATTNAKSKIRNAFEKGFEAGKDGMDLELSFEEFNMNANKESDSFVEDRFLPLNSSSDGILSVTRIAPLVVVGKMVYDIGTESNWNPRAAFDIFRAKPIWQRVMVMFVITRLIM